MTNIDSILKSRDITLPTKVHLVKAVVFPVVVYWCDSWTIKNAVWQNPLQYCKVISLQLIKINEKKNAEHWSTDASELWCWRRLSRVPWTARRINQYILKEISPEYSWERLMLKLKLQYFGHLMWKPDSFEKTLLLGKMEGGRRDQQRMRWLDGIPTQWTWVWVNSRRGWTGRPGMLQFMRSQRVRHDWVD